MQEAEPHHPGARASGVKQRPWGPTLMALLVSLAAHVVLIELLLLASREGNPVAPRLLSEPPADAVLWASLSPSSAVDPSRGPPAEAVPVRVSPLAPAPRPRRSHVLTVPDLLPGPGARGRSAAAARPQWTPPSAAAERGIDLSQLRLLLARHLADRRSYPRLARRAGVEGEVWLALSIGAAGELLEVRIDSSSGSELLDNAALDLARGAEPYPAPRGIAGVGRVEVRVPLEYRLVQAPQ